MFGNFLKEIEEKLKKQKKDLEEQLEKLGDWRKSQNSFQVNFPEYGEREDENADEVSAFSDRLSLGKRLEKNLEEVNTALEKINQGKYGICERCGGKIDEKRLRALPTAKECLACKDKK